MIRAKLKLAARKKLKGSWVWGLQIILINILSAFVILSLSTIAFLIFGIFCFAFCTTPLSSNNIFNDISIVLYYISISNGRIITAIFAQTFLLTGLVAATYDLINGKKTNNAWGLLSVNSKIIVADILSPLGFYLQFVVFFGPFFFSFPD